MGKVPVPGEVKTRLVPPLTSDEAARLYGAFLTDTLYMAVSVNHAMVMVFHPPSDDSSPLRDIVPSGVACIEERGADLGHSMHLAFLTLFGEGAAHAVVIGSDLPTLPASLLEGAFDALESGSDVVIGPSFDGGYYLIGLRQPQPALFESMVWSTDQVLNQTLARARAAGLKVEILSEWYDVDDVADLKWLISNLETNPQLRVESTRRVLATIADLPPAGAGSAHTA